MKKIISIFVMILSLAFSFALSACGEKFSTDLYINEGFSYHVVGGYKMDWAPLDNNMMTPASLADIAKYDEAVATKLAGKNIKALYLVTDYVLDNQPLNASLCTAYVDGEVKEYNQGYAVKVVRSYFDEEDKVYINDRWISDPKVASTETLTPSTLFMPKWVETAVEGEEHLGLWSDNPVCIAGAGKYTVIVAEYNTVGTLENPQFGLGLFKTEDLVETEMPKDDEPTQGEPGNDPVTGEPGNDPVTGEPGNDPVTGEPGNDPVTGEPGNDPVTGEPGNDPVTGEPGNDPVTEDPAVNVYTIEINGVPYTLNEGSSDLKKTEYEVTVEGVEADAVVVFKVNDVVETNIGDERDLDPDNTNNVIGNGTDGMKIQTAGDITFYVKVYVAGGYSIWATGHSTSNPGSGDNTGGDNTGGDSSSVVTVYFDISWTGVTEVWCNGIQMTKDSATGYYVVTLSSATTSLELNFKQDASWFHVEAAGVESWNTASTISVNFELGKAYLVNNVNFSYKWNNDEHKWYTCSISEFTN